MVVARDVDGVAFPGVSAFFVYCLVSFEDLVWPSNTGTNFRGYSYLGSRRFDFRIFLLFITALGLGDSPDFFAFTLSLLLPELTMALGRVWGLGDLRIFSGIIIDK